MDHRLSVCAGFFQTVHVVTIVSEGSVHVLLVRTRRIAVRGWAHRHQCSAVHRTDFSIKHGEIGTALSQSGVVLRQLTANLIDSVQNAVFVRLATSVALVAGVARDGERAGPRTSPVDDHHDFIVWRLLHGPRLQFGRAEEAKDESGDEVDSGGDQKDKRPVCVFLFVRQHGHNFRRNHAVEVGQTVGDAHQSAGKVGRHVDMCHMKAAHCKSVETERQNQADHHCGGRTSGHRNHNETQAGNEET